MTAYVIILLWGDKMSKINRVSRSAAINAYSKQIKTMSRKKYNVTVNVEFEVEVDSDNMIEAERKALKEMKAKFPFSNITVKR